MKIGLLTNFNGPNYGAMLQAWALWRTLAERGHEVTFFHSIWNGWWDVPLWKCFYGRSLHGMRSKFRDHFRHPITAFSQSFPATPHLRDFAAHHAAAAGFDAVIVGSDQVWNPRWVLPWLDIQFLGFVPDGCRRIAYAASLAVRSWGSEKRAEAGALLRRFDAVGVREKSGEDVVRSLADVPVRTVLDPVLLHGPAFYEPMFSDVAPPERSTIFTYFAGSTPVAAEARCLRAALSHRPKAELRSDKIPAVRGLPGRLLHRCGIDGAVPVASWLAGIARSSFVLSDSFHGTAFALLFHRPFAVRLFRGADEGMNERLRSLLDLVGLPERAFCDDELPRLPSLLDRPVDWAAVDRRLAAARADSLAFLERAARPTP